MKSLIVASALSHGSAMLKWCGHDPRLWHCVRYGDKLKGVYNAALVIRPIGEITDDHALWVHEVMKPRIFGPIEAVPGWVSPTPALAQLTYEA